jgi:hypothetical protein
MLEANQMFESMGDLQTAHLPPSPVALISHPNPPGCDTSATYLHTGTGVATYQQLNQLGFPLSFLDLAMILFSHAHRRDH